MIKKISTVLALILTQSIQAAPELPRPIVKKFNYIRGQAAKKEFQYRQAEGAQWTSYQGHDQYLWDSDTHFIVIETVEESGRVCHFGVDAPYFDPNASVYTTTFICFDEGLKFPAPTLSSQECQRIGNRLVCPSDPWPSIGVGNMLVGPDLNYLPRLIENAYPSEIRLTIDITYTPVGRTSHSAM